MFLLKIPAALIGLVLTLGGVAAFFWSIVLVFKYLMYGPSGPRLASAPSQSRPDIGEALAWFVGAVLAIALGTQLGRFARGDFD